jgi:rRNA-processing protein FCF1
LRALLDTSFLMLCAEVGRDLLSLVSDKLGEPIEPCTLPQVIAELRALTRAKGKRGRTAAVALEMAGRFRVIEPAVEGEVDEVLIATARREGCLLVTADLEIFRKALEKGMRAAFVSERGEVRLVT